MANKQKKTIGETNIYKTLHRKIKIEQHAPHNDGESHEKHIVIKWHMGQKLNGGYKMIQLNKCSLEPIVSVRYNNIHTSDDSLGIFNLTMDSNCIHLISYYEWRVHYKKQELVHLR